MQITGAFFAAIFLAVSAPFASSANESPSPGTFVESGFPVLEIVLAGFTEDEIHRSSWQGNVSCRLRADGKEYSSTAQIKGRGNYTWAQEKRPYAIKLDEKQDWFGFGAAKDWVLLANYTDETHLRNYFAFTLAAGFNFAFSPKAAHAQVFINGEYKGIYLITEKVEIDSRRLDIDVTRGDLLVELDNNYGYGETELITTKLGNLLVVKDPDAEEFDRKAREAGSGITFLKAKQFVKTQINLFEKGLKNGDSLSEIGKHMDIDSLVDWYIFNEILKNDDSVFNSSIYMYSRCGDKLYMGPVWDYDLCLAGIDRFGNRDPEGLQFLENPWERTGNWFLYLAERDDFNELVKARWRELYSSTLFSDSIEELKRVQILLREQVPYDIDIWDNRGVFVKMSDYNEAVGYLRHYINARINWLNSVWGDPEATLTPAATPEPSESPTPEATDEPEATPASAGETPPVSTAIPSENNTGKGAGGGCGAFSGTQALFVLLFAACSGAAAARPKKRDR